MTPTENLDILKNDDRRRETSLMYALEFLSRFKGMQDPTTISQQDATTSAQIFYEYLYEGGDLPAASGEPDED